MLTGLELPLILAVAEPLDAIYRSLCTYPYLAENGIAGHPEASADQELAAEARTILDDVYAREAAALRDRFDRRSSDVRAFAQAYVIAHEVGHHVQLLLDIAHRVAAADQQDPPGKNARSVRVELQADCFAGIWKHSSYQRGEISNEQVAEALQTAAVVGDDFQEHQATGTITPEDWTHGSSAQREHWLNVGFEEGKPGACDTFGA